MKHSLNQTPTKEHENTGQIFKSPYPGDLGVLYLYLKKYSFIIFTILLITSCKPDLNYDIRGYTQKIIVEGTISNEEFPKVYLSLNVPLWKKVDSVTVLENVIRTAKVTISDGVNTEILTSRWDKTHFPPYVYQGTELKGKEGKTYFLTVEYSGYTLYSQTTIPIATDIQAFNMSPVEGNDTLRILSMSFNINPVLKTGFRVFTKKKKDGFFVESPFVYNSEFGLSGYNRFDISPRPGTKDSSAYEGSYFALGDTIQVRLCTIDSTSTQFFKKLSVFSTSSSGVASNFFIGEKNTLPSNISTPGFGIWYGSGTRNYEVIIK